MRRKLRQSGDLFLSGLLLLSQCVCSDSRDETYLLRKKSNIYLHKHYFPRIDDISIILPYEFGKEMSCKYVNKGENSLSTRSNTLNSISLAVQY